MFGLISGALGIATGLKGLFSSKPKAPKERSPRDGIMSQAKGARQAADKYNFNPLTLLQAGAGHTFSGGGSGGVPPLASVEAISNGLRGIDDVLSGDAARRRAADQLELEIARVNLDRARSGVMPGAAAATSAPRSSRVAAAPAIFGRRAVQVPSAGAVHSSPRPSLNRPPVHPRTVNNEMVPVTWTDGTPSYIPRGVAGRLDIKPFDNLVAGDLEELRGELVGGAENTIRAVDVVRYQSNGTPLGQIVQEAPVYSGGKSTAELYETIFGPDHPATKKAKREESK